MKLYPNILFLLLILFISCDSDNSPEPIEPDPVVILPDEVEVYEQDKIENSLVLAVINGGTESFLIDKKGEKIFEWVFEDNLGNDLELLPDGRLLGIFKVENPEFSFGGFGGIIKILNIDGSVDWEYSYFSSNYIAHHDVEMLPNGNVIFMAWEKIEPAEAQALGINVDYNLYPETLIEVNPDTDQIVWEWHSWDHLVQDFDSNLPTFGQINENPQLINHTYNLTENGDIMHANGIDYDKENDVIFLSINYYSEVWVIDHSTTTVESSSHSGGNYGKGGDLIYRFGNPEAYNNINGTRLFYNNHFPNYLNEDEPGYGNVLIFMNGSNIEQSTIYELKMPNDFSLAIDVDNEPEIVWSFTDDLLFHGRISGAVRLKNGNTLICEGDYGFWEVTPNKEVVWKYNGEGNFWRAYNYLPTESAILNLGL